MTKSIGACSLIPAIVLTLTSASPSFSAPPPGTPKVTLSDTHAATCLVKVGDPLPDMELTDAKGMAGKLHTLRGGKAAIVVFWKGKHYARKELLEDLAALAKEHAAKMMVAEVHVGGAPGMPPANAAVHQWQDGKGTGYATIAKGDAKLPRIFVLDATGTIIWMDIEYAVDTRRQMRLAVDALFRMPQAALRRRGDEERGRRGDGHFGELSPSPSLPLSPSESTSVSASAQRAHRHRERLPTKGFVAFSCPMVVGPP